VQPAAEPVAVLSDERKGKGFWGWLRDAF
jgi:hypothetical protein